MSRKSGFFDIRRQRAVGTAGKSSRPIGATMRTILLAVLALVATAWGGYEHWRASRALAIGYELAAIAETQQAVIEAAGQIARIMDNGADQCAAHGQEPVALCFRLDGGKVIEAKGVCSNNPRPSGAARHGTN